MLLSFDSSPSIPSKQHRYALLAIRWISSSYYSLKIVDNWLRLRGTLETVLIVRFPHSLSMAINSAISNSFSSAGFICVFKFSFARATT